MDTKTPRHQDTKTPRLQDTRTPGLQDTRTPRHQDTRTPRHQDTRTPRHPDTQTQLRITYGDSAQGMLYNKKPCHAGWMITSAGVMCKGHKGVKV